MPQTGASLALRATRRANALKQCKEAKAEWDANPGRNLVLFFDGTGNVLGNSRDTNVVKLFRMIDKQVPFEEASQIAYYDPGLDPTPSADETAIPAAPTERCSYDAGTKAGTARIASAR